MLMHSLEWIADNHFAGIPMDVIVHLIIGLVIYYGIKALTGSNLSACATVLFLAVVKEMIDMPIVIAQKMWAEPIKDIGVTLFFPLVLMSFGLWEASRRSVSICSENAQSTAGNALKKAK